MEKSPAVSADRLTTSSPKRDEVRAGSDEEDADRPFETSVPDQQVVIKDQKVIKRNAWRRCLGISFESLKHLMSRIIVTSYKVRFKVSKEVFPVWE